MHRRAFLAVAAAALLVAASGCTAIPGVDDRTEQPPDGEDVAAAFDDLDGVEATQVSTLNGSEMDSFTRTIVRVAFADGTHEPRQFNRVLAPESDAGDVTVTGGNQTIVYDASENEVTRIPQSGASTSAPSDRAEYYAEIVAAAHDDSTLTPRAGEGVSPLPVVPQATTTTEASAVASVDESDIEGYEVTYLGTDTLADRSAHGFRMTAVGDAALDVNRTLWLDSEYYYPLRVEQTVALEEDEDPIHVETRLENVTFDPELGADAFDWEPPSDATVETVSVSSETYDSRTALTAAASLSVPEPDVPDGYRFDSGRVFDENFTQVSADYVHDESGGSVTVSAVEVTNSSNGGLNAGESVTVAGQDAQYVVTERTSLVSWRCGDVQRNVMATDLDREELFGVAESVACQ